MTSPVVMKILEQTALCLSKQFGNNCEVVVHELDHKNNSSNIVLIENGHVSQRKQGGGPSAVVLKALSRNSEQLNDKLAYLTRTHDGHILKSSTMYIRDENNEISAIFAINYDVTNLMAAQGAIDSLISVEEKKVLGEPETIPLNVSELLENLIEQSIKIIGKPAALMSKDEKIRAIQFLNDSGAFLVTKSGDRVSKEFGISKYTMYSYIDANKNKDD